MKRYGKAEEIADAVVWLASENTKFITGQTITLDGGTSL
jgi:NAD(P)-dependent dehydrogenase (short-subunit alcohol dehydrogenase family)